MLWEFFDQEKREMKSIKWMLTGSAMVMMLGACGGGGHSSNGGGNNPPTSPPAQADVFTATVQSIIATAPDDAEPQATDSIMATAPEDKEPVSS